MFLNQCQDNVHYFILSKKPLVRIMLIILIKQVVYIKRFILIEFKMTSQSVFAIREEKK